MRLLVCVAFHYNKDRKQYLFEVLRVLRTYEIEVDIIVDTNEDFYLDKEYKAKKVIHDSLKHPFHLTSMHRKHILENINNYDVFMYLEDDMVVPYENFLNYLDNFRILFPKFVPGFIRIEYANDEEYSSDVVKKEPLVVINEGGKHFAKLSFPSNYHAFWIMPQKELKESLKHDFTEPFDGREFNAMYVGWGLQKDCLVEIENNQISRKSYSYHIPNNYAKGTGFTRLIKPKNIFT